MADRVEVGVDVKVTGLEQLKDLTNQLGQVGDAAKGIGGGAGGMDALTKAFQSFGAQGMGALTGFAQGFGVPGAAIGALAGLLGGLGVAAFGAAGAIVALTRSQTDLAFSTASSIKETTGLSRKLQTDFQTAAAYGASSATVLGENWQRMDQQITRTFTAQKMAKGLMGDKGLFARWGITPEFIAKQEQQLADKEGRKKMGALDWAQVLVGKREELERKRDEAMQRERIGGTKQQMARAEEDRTKYEGLLRQFSDDTVKMLRSPELARAVQEASTEGIGRVKEAMQATQAMGMPPELIESYKKQAADLRLTQSILSEQGAVLDERSSAMLLRPMTEYYQDLIDLNTMLGPAIADLKGTVGAKAWEGLAGMMTSFTDNLDPATVQTLNQLTQALADFNSSLIGQKIGEGLAWFVNQLASFARDIQSLYADLKPALEPIDALLSEGGFAALFDPAFLKTTLGDALDQMEAAFQAEIIGFGSKLAAALTGIDFGDLASFDDVGAALKVHLEMAFSDLKASLEAITTEDIGAALRAVGEKIYNEIMDALNFFRTAISKIPGMGWAAPAKAELSPEAAAAALAPSADAAAGALDNVKTSLDGVAQEAKPTGGLMQAFKGMLGIKPPEAIPEVKAAAPAVPLPVPRPEVGAPEMQAAAAQNQAAGATMQAAGGTNQAAAAGIQAAAGSMAAIPGQLQAALSGAAATLAAAGTTFGSNAAAVISAAVSNISVNVNVSGPGSAGRDVPGTAGG